MPTYNVTNPATGQKLRLTGDSPPTEIELEEIFASQAPAVEPETTAEGLAGAVTRGAAPYAAAAGAGALLGAPFGGVGAAPGAVAGMGAMALTEFVGDPVVETINSLFGTTYTKPTDAMQDFLTRIGVPEASTEAERIIQSVSQAAAGAGGAVALGKQLAKTAGPIVAGAGETLAAQPAAQIVGGAGAGGAGQLATELGAGPIGQIAASLGGGIAGAKVTGLRAVPQAKQLPSDLRAAKEAGIDVLTTDVVPPKTFAGKWLRATGERIPLVGAGEARKGQQKQRIESVRSLLRDYGAEDAASASEEVMKDLVTKRAGEVAKYSKLKSDVISQFDDTQSVAKVVKTTQAIDDQIGKLKALKTKEVQPVIDRLEDWRSSIQDQPLSNIETLRKQIGESFKAPELVAARSTGEKALNSIYGALRDDMGDYIKTYGQRRDFDKWKIANKRLSGLAGELKTGALKSVLKSGDATPEVVERMLFSKKPSEVRTLYAGLTEQGKAHARTAIIARAAEKAGGMENISPAKFTNEVKRLGKSTGVFFKGDELKRINGLTRALDITRRAATAAEMPATGVQVALPVGAAILTDILGGAGAATAAGLTVGLASRVYESAPVRNLLIKLPQTIKGSPEEAAMFKRLVSTITQQKEQKK